MHLENTAQTITLIILTMGNTSVHKPKAKLPEQRQIHSFYYFVINCIVIVLQEHLPSNYTVDKLTNVL